MTIHYYQAFDLILASEIALPSLEGSRVEAPATSDVRIARGVVRVPEGATVMGDMAIAVDGATTVLAIDGVGAFRLEAGAAIVVEQAQGAGDDELLLFLLGTVIGTLLYQRGLLPMHCNAVEVGGRAFLFCGDSGAGKSTLAAFLESRGHRLLTDDVCPLRFTDDAIVALPGLARLKLWGESLTLLGRGRKGLRQLPWRVDKYEMPLAGGRGTAPLPVGALYHLRDDRDGRVHGIHRVHALDAINTVSANIYRRRVADLMGLGPVYLANTVRIVRDVPLFSFNRAWGLSRFETEALAAERHMIALAEGDGAA